MIVARIYQRSQQVSAATSTAGNWDKNTNEKASRGGNQNWKTTMMVTKKELSDVMLKLEGKRPTCWNFVSEWLSQQHVMKHFETHRKFIERKGKYPALATANCEILILWSTCFRCT